MRLLLSFISFMALGYSATTRAADCSGGSAGMSGGSVGASFGSSGAAGSSSNYSSFGAGSGSSLMSGFMAKVLLYQHIPNAPSSLPAQPLMNNSYSSVEKFGGGIYVAHSPEPAVRSNAITPSRTVAGAPPAGAVSHEHVAQNSKPEPVRTAVVVLKPPRPEHYNPSCDCTEFESDIHAVNQNLGTAALLVSDKSKIPGSVPWSESLEFAQENAKKGAEPYAIYFCAESVAETAGEGPSAAVEYKKRHDGRAPQETIFENAGVLDAFRSAGIAIFVKVPLTSENAALAGKWNAHDNTLVLVAPNDEKLISFGRLECTDQNVADYLQGFKEKYKMWKWRAQLKAVQERNP